MKSICCGTTIESIFHSCNITLPGMHFAPYFHHSNPPGATLSYWWPIRLILKTQKSCSSICLVELPMLPKVNPHYSEAEKGENKRRS